MKSTTITACLGLLVIFSTVNSVYGSISDKNPTTTTSNRRKPAAAALKKVEYDNARPTIRTNYYADLDLLAKTIKDDNYAVSLRGHADAVGKYKYNWMLSDERAVNVKKYLISKGVSESRIITTPFGSTVPIASNSTPEGRQKNRRVEIELKKISK